MGARGATGLGRSPQAVAGSRKDKLDFIVIGAQKSATTTLFEHLRRHPEVAVPQAKEAPFFSHDEIYHRGWPTYLEELTRDRRLADAGLIWGTVTPQYMMGTVEKPLRGAGAGAYDERTVPRRIREQLPDVLLVAILRDPVARAISHHAMQRNRGSERRSFDEAIEQLLRPEQQQLARTVPKDCNSYVAFGEYGRILGGYLDVFPRERLMILFTEELERAPLETLASMYRFIGASDDFVPEGAQKRYYVGRRERSFDWHQPDTWLGPSSPFSPQGLQRVVRRVPGVRASWRALPFETRRRLLRPYSKAAAQARARNRRKPAADGSAEASPRPETIARLHEHFAEDTLRLTGLLDGGSPPWVGREEPAAGPRRQG